MIERINENDKLIRLDKEGRVFELRYDLKAVEMIERATGISIVNLIQNPPSIFILKQMIGYALHNEEGNKVSNQTAIEISEKLIIENGITECFTKAITRILEDCSFLFQ